MNSDASAGVINLHAEAPERIEYLPVNRHTSEGIDLGNQARHEHKRREQQDKRQ
jgi:hypothetical protein